MRPSGSQPTTFVAGRPQKVSRRGAAAPWASATHTSGPPEAREVKAMCVPSGEKRGYETGAPSSVSRQARPPVSGASHTSFAAVKVISSPRTSGWRR